YVPGERLRLEAYRKLAAAQDSEGIDEVRAELVDRYGQPPPPVQRLFAVTAFRHTCRSAGVTEVTIQGSTVRFTPLELSESGVVRLKRLYPKAVYKSVTSTVSVTKHTERATSIRMEKHALRAEPLLVRRQTAQQTPIEPD